MAFNASKASGGGGTRQDNVPIGNYPARLVQLIDLGHQAQRPFKGKDKPPIDMIRTVYELPTEFCTNEEGEEDHEKPRWLGEEMPFYNLKAVKARCTERYMALDPSLACEGEWDKLIGAACTLTVVHNPKRDDPSIVYANIGSTAPPMKGFDVPPLVNPELVWTLDDPDMEVFDKFPDFLQAKIKGNLNYKGSVLEARVNGTDEPVAADNPAVEGGDATVSNPYGG